MNIFCVVCSQTSSPSVKKDICHNCYIKFNRKCSQCNTIKNILEYHAGRAKCKVCYASNVAKRVTKPTPPDPLPNDQQKN